LNNHEALPFSECATQGNLLARPLDLEPDAGEEASVEFREFRSPQQ